MKYYARKDKKGYVQLLNDHLSNVAEIASSYSALPSLARLVGLIHDIGKFSSAFQKYLFDENSKRGEVTHSLQGVFFLMEMSLDNIYHRLVEEIASLSVAAHHNKLQDMVSPDGEKVFFAKFSKEKEDILDLSNIEKNAGNTMQDMEQTLANLFAEAANEVEFIVEEIKKSYNNSSSAQFAVGLLVKYIYSCLVDADRLDAYLFDIKKEYITAKADWDDLIKVFEKNISQFRIDSDIAKIRSFISSKCKQAAIKEPAIYHLSVPTGGGKTLSSLRFALHHAKNFDKKRIIYVIPYLSIIEQTANNIRDILDIEENSNIILEHHSDVREPKDEEEAKYIKLASSRWDNPIIITTLVQFLETVMSAKSGKLRKLHNMQDAVIIFDEIQSLPIHSIHLFNEVATFLNKVLGCTILLCTATQPLLDKTKRGNLLLPVDANLIEDTTPLFADRKRTSILIEDEKDLEEFAKFILDKAEKNKSCLVIVNTKRTARQLYNILKSKNIAIPTLHLSTSMCPAHRLDTLATTHSHLASKNKFICISTQLIEAGVDISFDCVIRAMAGLDSVIQAAGRCNRSGAYKEPRNVYVIPLKGENLDKLTDIKKGKAILARIIRENPKLDLLSKDMLDRYYKYYFFERSQDMDFSTNDNSIYSMLSANNLGKENFKNRTGKGYPHILSQAFATASDSYQTIDSNTETVVVIYGQSKEILEKYRRSYALEERLKFLRALKKYSIQLRYYELEALLAKKAITVIDSDFGLKVLDKHFYSKEIGLALDTEYKDYIV